MSSQSEPILEPKPRLRGVSHQYGFFGSLALGLGLVLMAQNARVGLIALIYALSLSALLGTSALYHRVDWSPGKRRWMRRLDRTMIFVLIAGTCTPFGLLALEGQLATVMMIILWSAVVVGMIFNLVWITAPKWMIAMLCVAVGWVGAAMLPTLWHTVGKECVFLIILGGFFYTAGAVIYALKRPNPFPQTFGYHEIFHAFVLAAAIAHYIAISVYVILPATA